VQRLHSLEVRQSVQRLEGDRRGQHLRGPARTPVRRGVHVREVGLLALVAGQHVEPADGSDGRDGRDGRWRITKGTAPDRVISTVDPASRHVHKTRTHKQDGYKAHLACEPQTGIYTAVALRPGAGAEHHEGALAPDLLADEHEPLDVFGDTAYSAAATCHELTGRGHRLFVKPAPLGTAVPGGFSLDDFAIDTAAGTVTCPAGHQAPLSAPSGQHHQRKALFTDQCADCPLRAQCTTAKTGRIVTIRPHHDEQTAPAAKPPPTRPGRTPTAAGGHLSNAPWPGSWRTATSACATAARSRTTPGYTPAPPP
jgi:hypothetical protein